MVCTVLLAVFTFFNFFNFLYHVFIVMVQELACSASYGIKKTLISKQNNKVKLITIISKCVMYLARHQHKVNKGKDSNSKG